MNDRLQRFEAIAARARMEDVPSLDVTARVLATLQAERDAFERPFVFFAAGSAAAASAVFATSLPLLFAYLDPLGALLKSMVEFTV